MATFSLHAIGAAEPDEVWERYVVPSRWASWSPQIRSVRVDADRLSAGLRGAVVGPLGVKVPFTILAVNDQARTWEWEVAFLGVKIRLHHAVAPADEGTRTDLRLHGPLVLLVPYLPIAQLAMLRLVRP